MWNYNGTTGLIELTQGDTPTFTITCTITDDSGSTSTYTPVPSDKIVFAMRKSKDSGEPLLTKTAEIDNGIATITFEESDTKELDTGKYYYEVSLNSGEYHCTFIVGKKIYILPAIYN